MNNFFCKVGLVVSFLLALSFPIYTIFWIYPQFTQIITFEKEVNAKQIATHISKMMAVDTVTHSLSKESITDRFIETLKEAQSDFDLTKIKVFSARGEVLYSTDVKDIGTFNTNTYFNDVVAKGKNFSKIVRKDEKTMEGETVRKDVVETYVPLNRDKHFIGAFEIYYDTTYSGHSINSFVSQSRVLVVTAALILLLCILLISVSAIALMKKLTRTEIQMQKMKDQVPSLYKLDLDELGGE